MLVCPRSFVLLVTRSAAAAFGIVSARVYYNRVLQVDVVVAQIAESGAIGIRMPANVSTVHVREPPIAHSTCLHLRNGVVCMLYWSSHPELAF